MSAAKYGHSNLNREKALQSRAVIGAVQDTEMKVPDAKLPLIVLDPINFSAKAAPFFSLLVCRTKQTPHYINDPRASNDRRRENNQDRTKKESSQRNVRPRVLRQNSTPPRFVDLSMMLSAAPVDTVVQEMLLRIRR